MSWQTLWHGPWLVDGDLGSPGDVSGALPAMLERNRELWAGQASDFLADSGSSVAEYLAAIGGGLYAVECELQQVDERAGADGGGAARVGVGPGGRAHVAGRHPTHRAALSGAAHAGGP